MLLPSLLVNTISSNYIWVGFTPGRGSGGVSRARTIRLASSEFFVAEIASAKSWAISEIRSANFGSKFVGFSTLNSWVTSVKWTKFLWNQFIYNKVNFKCILPNLILSIKLEQWNSLLCIIQIFDRSYICLNFKFMKFVSRFPQNFVCKVIHGVSLYGLVKSCESGSPFDKSSVFADRNWFLVDLTDADDSNIFLSEIIVLDSVEHTVQCWRSSHIISRNKWRRMPLNHHWLEVVWRTGRCQNHIIKTHGMIELWVIPFEVRVLAEEPWCSIIDCPCSDENLSQSIFNLKVVWNELGPIKSCFQNAGVM